MAAAYVESIKQGHSLGFGKRQIFYLLRTPTKKNIKTGRPWLSHYAHNNRYITKQEILFVKPYDIINNQLQTGTHCYAVVIPCSELGWRMTQKVQMINKCKSTWPSPCSPQRTATSTEACIALKGIGACCDHHALIYQPSSLDPTTMKSDISQHGIRYRAQVHICRVRNWYIMWCLCQTWMWDPASNVWYMKVPLEERLSFNKLFVLCLSSLGCLYLYTETASVEQDKVWV